MATHPFLTGNYAPVQTEHDLTACSFTGSIPKELWGGQYIRNGSNPSYLKGNERRYHWFDGDGMLSGVWFKRKGNIVEPCFVNRFLVTDILLAERTHGSNVLFSIATLISPIISPVFILFAIAKAIFLCLKYGVSRLSVANTGIIYHDSKALASCESGPFLQVELPTLKTIGWCDFTSIVPGTKQLSFFEEWATGHPRVDPVTSELIFFGSSFLPPYLRYSVIPANGLCPSLLAIAIPTKSPKLMHDFGVSLKHTVILDLPLTINPLNMLKGNPVVHFDSKVRSRFGIFPRYKPEQVRWFESESCAIFHTANTWSEVEGDDELVNMLVCRFKTPKLLYTAGNVPPPVTMVSDDVCRLFYYRFNLSSPKYNPTSTFALSVIPFEFPSISYASSMQCAKYIYGCTMRWGSFDLSIGGTAKVDCLVRIDVERLIERGRNEKVEGSIVDNRSVLEIIADNRTNPDDPMKIFVFDDYHFAQECTFVSRESPRFEADGYLLTYVFDERQLQSNGMAREDAVSELWIIDALNMSDVIGKIRLPQRVPYGFHGDYISEERILQQKIGGPRPTITKIRSPLQISIQTLYLIREGLKLFWRMIRDFEK